MTPICPACRRADEDGVYLWTLDHTDQGWVCKGCGRAYGEVEGVPLVATDEATLVGAFTAHSEEVVAIYQRSTEGPLQEWLREVVGPGAIELGSGLGVRTDSVLLDSHLGVLVAAGGDEVRPGGMRVCADVHDPPFPPESFDCVVMANVLDSVCDPLHTFLRGVGLCRPGGRVIVTCPFAFNPAITPMERWFSPEQLASGLGAVEAGVLTVADHRILHWPLRITERLTHDYRVDALIFRRGPPA